MSEQYEICLRDENRSLGDLLREMGLYEACACEDIDSINITQVRINTAHRAWHICIDCAELSSLSGSLSALATLQAEIAGFLPELSGLEVFFEDADGQPLCTSVSPSPQEWLTVNWESVKSTMAQHNAGYASWMSRVFWKLAGVTLSVILPHSFGVELLTRRGLCSEMAQVICQLGGPVLEVKLEVGDFGEDIDALDAQLDLEEQSYIESLMSSHAEQGKAAREIILGKRISTQLLRMCDIAEEENAIAVIGEVIKLDKRTTKTGRTLVTGALSDMTDSIAFKLFGESALQAADALEVGMWVVAKGNLEPDKYSNDELVLTLTDLMRASNPFHRSDDAATKRVELHLHTKMSAMDGIADTTEAVKLAAKWGHQAIAITDHGVVHDFPEAYSTASRLGIKVIYGCEGYLIDDSRCKEKPHHIIIIAKNRKGLANLYRLVSDAHTLYFYRHPRIPRQALDEYREGLIVGSACEAGELFQAVIRGETQERLLEIAAYYDYLEIQPVSNNSFLIREGKAASIEQLRDMNRLIVKVGEALDKPVVATCDVHYIHPHEATFRKILLASQGYEDAEKQAELHFRTTDEMLEEFAYLGQEKSREVVVDNTNRIAALTEDMAPVPSGFAPPSIDGAEEEVRRLAYERACELYGDCLPEPVRERLEMELEGIIGHGYAVLYLIAQKLVSRSVSDGYVVGSRGSVGSSFVATMCGITEVNPLPPHYRCPACKYSEFPEVSLSSGVDLPQATCPCCGNDMMGDGQDIYFATFMGMGGDKEPDIDLNFSGEYQQEAHKFVEEIFGSEYIYRVGTIATLADKTVFGFVKKYLDEKGISKRSCEVDRLIQGCVGVRRSTGQHPGGLVVIPKDRSIYEFTPVQYPANNPEKGKCITHFDFHSALESRLVKLDILGHDDPTMIHRLHRITGIDPTSVPLADAKVLSIFNSIDALGVDKSELGLEVGTWGIPEFNTQFTQQMLEVIRPKSFSELIYVSGFSHGTGVWLGNALDLIQSETASISEVISVRDCIMTDLIRKGVLPKLAFSIMEKVRKGRGISDEEAQAMKDCGVPEWYIKSCKKIQYLFPKAHAVAYVTMAVRIAWFKVYHPEAFYAAYFSIRADSFDANMAVGGIEAIKRGIGEIERKGREASVKERSTLSDMQLALEAQLRNISFSRVDVHKSDALEFEIIAPGILRCPIRSLSGVGEAAARAIVEARGDTPFLSIEDLKMRTGVSVAVIDILRVHGCLDGWSETSQMSLF